MKLMVRDAPPDEQGDLIRFIGMLSSDVGRAELVKLHGAQLEKQTAGDAVSPDVEHGVRQSELRQQVGGVLMPVSKLCCCILAVASQKNWRRVACWYI